MSSINRRNFLGGLAALAAVASIPAPAEARTFIGVDLGKNTEVISISINGMPCERLILEGSDDGEMWHLISTHEGDGITYADELIQGRYYRLSLKQGDEEIYATDVSLISDQRVYESVGGKLKRLLGWRVRDRAKENRYGLVGHDGPTLLTPQAARALEDRSFFASDNG